jgi:hypothetical protein
MFQLGLFMVILTNLVMSNIQTLIDLSWNIGSSISISFVYSPFKLFINLAYWNIIISCKLLLNATNNSSLRSIHKFFKVIWMSMLGVGLFQEQGVFQMLTSSWLEFKCLNQCHCTSPHNLVERGYINRLWNLHTLAHLSHHITIIFITIIFPCITLTKKHGIQLIPNVV